MTTVLDTETVAQRPLIADKPAADVAADVAASVPAGAAAETADTVEEQAGFPEAGLRELTGHDWIIAAAWGVIGAMATTAVSVLFLPLHLIPLTLVLGAGLGMLGYLDYCTQLIRNTHVLAFGAAAAVLLCATQILNPSSSILIPALAAAAATFVFMLALAAATNTFGGGDIKLSPVPAALLAAVSPLAALIWLLFTFVLCTGVMIAAKLSGSKRKHMAMAPFMAVAAVMAIGAYGLLSQALGI